MVTFSGSARYLLYILNLYCINIADSGILRLPSVQVSEQVCPDPPPSRHGTFQVWGGNHLIEFICDEGFFALGPTFGSCDPETGRWSVEPPKCVGTGCPNPDPPENGHVITKENGYVAIYRCNDGYKLMGEETVYCHKNLWSHSTPKCAERFPSQGTRRQLYQESSYNETLLAQEEYQMEVSLADDTCYHQFRKPPKIEHATFKIMYEYIRQKNLWAIIANYTCSEGYHLEDQHSRFYFCRWYRWRAKVTPKCVEDVKGYDPCEPSNGGCEEICVSYPDGHYQCECSKGYVLGFDKRSCVDLDECKFENGNCERYCVNVIGSYICICPKGYLSDDRRCLDVDECATPESHNCIGGCINTPGSYTCNCSLSGFAPSKDKIQCEDLDECRENNGGCEDICVNEYGSYRCRCEKAGYQVGADKHNCTDVDECAKFGSKICQNGICLNTDRSYTCECYKGYIRDEKNTICKDVNECLVNNGGCDMTCINMPGSYQCACPDAGYRIGEDGHSCEDKNECGMQTSGCEDECVNAIGSFFCLCNKPYKVLGNDSRTCTYCDVKHYYNQTTYQCEPCPPHSWTSNPYSTELSDCVCEMGYIAELGNTTVCKDINECLSANNGCEYQCENIPGSAHCLCTDGYQLLNDSKTCGDINECLSNNGNCAQLCINIDGSFHCDCNAGFSLDSDRHSCEDIDECYLGKLQCSDICENTIGSAHCVCERGYILDEDNQTCADVDECILGIDVCEDICINIKGSYQCECSNPGLKLSWDLASCADINECMEGGQRCSEACVNTYGSFRCTCFQAGYVYETDNGTCRDIDECQSNGTNMCQQLCINSDGSYTCDCFPGYSRYSFNECSPCPEGFYREMNDIECQACPIKSSTTGTARTSIIDCICQDGRSVGVKNGYLCNATEPNLMSEEH